MTLAVGDKVVKLDREGKPLTTDKEVYIKYEVEQLTSYFTKNDQSFVIALLRKVE